MDSASNRPRKAMATELPDIRRIQCDWNCGHVQRRANPGGTLPTTATNGLAVRAGAATSPATRPRPDRQAAACPAAAGGNAADLPQAPHQHHGDQRRCPATRQVHRAAVGRGSARGDTAGADGRCLRSARARPDCPSGSGATSRPAPAMKPKDHRLGDVAGQVAQLEDGNDDLDADHRRQEEGGFESVEPRRFGSLLEESQRAERPPARWRWWGR